MSTLRLAVIGAGGIAQSYHLPSLRRLASEDPTLELAALCDQDTARAQGVAARFGWARAYHDYRAMLDAETPDAVWVLVPTPAMCAVAGDCLRRGVPTLLEKPPGQDAAEARALWELAEMHGTPHQVAFNRRHAPLLKQMRALLDEAGGAQAVSCQFYRVRRTEAHFAYGTGLHGLDTLRFLAAAEVRAVQTRPGPRASALVTLTYADGSLGLMEMLPQAGLQSERYTAHAGERTVIVDGVVGWLTLYPGFLQCYEQGRLALCVDNAASPAPSEIVSGFYGESAHFIACLRAGRRPAPDLADALRSVELAEAVERGLDRVFPD